MKPVSEAKVVSRYEHPHVTTGNAMERTVTTRNPTSPAIKRKKHEKYMRCLHPYLSQHAVSKTPRRAKKLKAMKTP